MSDAMNYPRVSWIFSILAPSLRKRLVDLNPTTAKDAWTYIEAIFQDNKLPRAMALKPELRNLKLRDLSIDGYFQKIESIVSVHNGLGSPLSNDDVVTFALRVQNPLVDATSASPMVLLAKSNTSARRGPSLEKVNNPCWSFAKGSYRFGDTCKYLHNCVHGKSTLLPRTSGSASSVSGVTRSDLDMLPNPLTANYCLVLLGCPIREWLVIPTRGLVSDWVTTTRGPLSTAGGSDAFWSTAGGSPCTWNFTAANSVYDRGRVQATLLPNAFNTTTLQEPAFGNWNMDTGVSSHLNDSVHCLSDILNMCIYPSVAVGDGRFIPVTNSGHTKETHNSRMLLRCDSTGELYPVMNPSTIPHAFLTNQYTWHQRLGHPGSKVLLRLVSSDSISYNKEKLPVLCHPCQRKHVKLLFVSSSSSVTSCFDIVHSDLWTSPIPSLSGSNNDTTNVIVVSGGHTIEKVTEFGNNKGTQVENVGQTPISSTNPNIGADVVVPLESIRATSEQFANTAYGFFLGKRWLTPLLPAMLGIFGVNMDGLNQCLTRRTGYFSSRLALRMDRSIIELRADVELNNTIAVDECLKNLSSDTAKNLKNLRQAARVARRNKMRYLDKREGSLNVVHGSSSSTPIIDMIDKLERQIIDCKLMLVHDDGNLLVPTGNVDSESEVEVVFDEPQI
ncbi:ribonuclease H-like domain-containing protein [Tanacetum coccineum]